MPIFDNDYVAFFAEAAFATATQLPAFNASSIPQDYRSNRLQINSVIGTQRFKDENSNPSRTITNQTDDPFFLPHVDISFNDRQLGELMFAVRRGGGASDYTEAETGIINNIKELIVFRSLNLIARDHIENSGIVPSVEIPLSRVVGGRFDKHIGFTHRIEGTRSIERSMHPDEVANTFFEEVNARTANLVSTFDEDLYDINTPVARTSTLAKLAKIQRDAAVALGQGVPTENEQRVIDESEGVLANLNERLSRLQQLIYEYDSESSNDSDVEARLRNQQESSGSS